MSPIAKHQQCPALPLVCPCFGPSLQARSVVQGRAHPSFAEHSASCLHQAAQTVHSFDTSSCLLLNYTTLLKSSFFCYSISYIIK